MSASLDRTRNQQGMAVPSTMIVAARIDPMHSNKIGRKQNKEYNTIGDESKSNLELIGDKMTCFAGASSFSSPRPPCTPTTRRSWSAPPLFFYSLHRGKKSYHSLKLGPVRNLEQLGEREQGTGKASSPRKLRNRSYPQIGTRYEEEEIGSGLEEDSEIQAYDVSMPKGKGADY
ncbi:hypothetical protein NL676_034632 [Syzygium grande]|nr:hypothetical protein NL676_034632 [Syzygium grande]